MRDPEKKKACNRRWVEMNREKAYAANTRYAQHQKAKVFDHYGRICKGCGFADERVLTIDHVNNDGAAHREQIGCSQTYNWLIKNNYPDNFQTLCRNCQWIKYDDYRKEQKCKSRGTAITPLNMKP